MSAHLREMWRSAARDALFHATTPEAAKAIMIGGFILPEKPMHGADYGIGVYLTGDWGGVGGYNRGAVIECGLTPGTRLMFTPEIDDAYKMTGAALRVMAEAEGYHGIDDGDVVCVFNPAQVKPYRIIEPAESRERTRAWGEREDW